MLHLIIYVGLKMVKLMLEKKKSKKKDNHKESSAEWFEFEILGFI